MSNINLMKLKVKLINEYPFISTLLFQCPLKEIKGEKEKFPAYTDFKSVYININSPYYLEFLEFLVLHEYMHILLEHKRRSKKYREKGADQTLLNISMDLVINEILLDIMGKNKCSQDGVYISTLHQFINKNAIEEIISLKQNDLFCFENVYNILKRYCPKPEGIFINPFPHEWDDNEKENNEETEEYSPFEDEDDEDEKGGESSFESEEEFEDEDEKGGEGESSAEFNDERDRFHHGLSYLPDVLLEKLSIKKSKTTIEEVINKIKHKLISMYNKREADIKNYRELSRVYHNPIFHKKRRKEFTVAVVLDSSGSIGFEQYEKFCSFLNKDVQNFKFIYIVADDMIRQVCDNIKDLKVPKDFGGTDFRPAIEYAENQKVSAIIYLTDLYGEMPDTCSVPLFWVTDNKQIKPHIGEKYVYEKLFS